MILYTDIDPACCAVLEARVADGSLPPGDVVCADVRDMTAETHEWEPPRLFPGTRTISARWRLGLMGYPLGWLDVDAAALARIRPLYPMPPGSVAKWLGNRAKVNRWWNKQGVAMTGNAQVPQCVAAIAAGLVEATQAGLLETSR